MISVEDATTRITAAFKPLPAESIAIGDAAGRVLAEDAVARANQPPEAVSSMDGYAVRTADARAGATLNVIGASPAGNPYRGMIGVGEAVRIFTGGVVPGGADAIVIQEDTTANGAQVTLAETAVSGRHIRLQGLDFKTGETLLRKGRRLTARDLSLLAAADLAAVNVVRKPRVVFAATGDELSRPGEPRKPGGIVASSGYGLSAMIAVWGGEPVDLGIVPDTMDAVAGIAERSKGSDLVVTLGGASVGDHDLIQKALGPEGFALDFWRIAMRPGKPLIFGRLGTTPLLGLPGNPVSTLVCALLFLRPAIAAMLGETMPTTFRRARLLGAMPENASRQDYVRARTELHNGDLWVEPFAVQDSSMQSVLARADALIVRTPHAKPAQAGETVEILPLD
ncbi:MAG TPA: gephyrin-like molybdotransferase Glp [Rhizomicrobium sp.]|jgi:molybdopterin molybdotransferase